jgi:hypothetical protein
MTTTPEVARLAEEAKQAVIDLSAAVIARSGAGAEKHATRVRDSIDALAALSQPDEARDARNPSIPLSAIRPIAVEAIREVMGCPDVRGKDGKYLVETLEEVAKAAAESFAAMSKEQP